MVELKIKKDDTEINVMDKSDVESALNDKEDTSNRVTSLSSSSTDTQYPSAKCVYDGLDNKISKSSTTGLVKNDGTIDTTEKASTTHNHGLIDQFGRMTGYASKNVVTDSNGFITAENKPTIPSASSTTPSADVSGGAIGSSSNYAKADHQHPLSSAYATSGHNHSGTYAPVSHNQALSTISDADTEEVLVTYTDSTTETLHLVIWGGATIVTNVVLTTDSALSNPTFTATVTNSKGNGITGKTVTFYVNNTSMGTGTTNSNGVATYTYQGYAPPMAQYKATCDGVDSNIIE